ncbi:MAG: addiction module protein [Leptolyngbya sp. SIOISBB]|nr:addiction module protein [Leptolyngbya sp. SIOISBB]
MEIDIALLKEAALNLSPYKRLQLINTLWENLKGVEQDKIDQAWLQESKDRLRAFRQGEVGTVDGETALAGLKAKLSQGAHTAR